MSALTRDGTISCQCSQYLRARGTNQDENCRGTYCRVAGAKGPPSTPLPTKRLLLKLAATPEPNCDTAAVLKAKTFCERVILALLLPPDAFTAIPVPLCAKVLFSSMPFAASAPVPAVEKISRPTLVL